MPLNTKSSESISRHPANNSPSKMMYSFGKARRFCQSSLACHALYVLPSTRSGRATSMGAGKKVDITRLHETLVPPNLYNTRSEFDVKDRGASFRISRDKTATSFIHPFGRQPDKPGPGHYQPKEAHKALQFSFNRGVRTEPEDPNPSPGHYDLRNEFKQSKYKGVASFRYAKLLSTPAHAPVPKPLTPNAANNPLR
jgi:hypothetical protein